MELQDKAYNETDASDDSSSSNDSDFSDDSGIPYEQGVDSDSDMELLLQSPNQHHFHYAGIISYMQLPDDLTDDEEEPKNLQELHQGDKSKNLKDLGLRNPKAWDLGIHESTFHEPINPSLQELSFHDKVKYMKDEFKGIPGPIIRNVLRRDGVQEDLNKAIACLKSTSGSEGTSSKAQQEGKKVTPKRPKPVKEKRQHVSRRDRNRSGFGIEKASEGVSNPPSHNNLGSDVHNERSGEHDIASNLEEKVSLLQETFNHRHRDIAKNKSRIAQEVTPIKKVPQFELNTILIRGLNKSTSYDTIKTFAESNTQEQVLEIVKSDDETSAFITFENTMKDFHHAKGTMEMHTLVGANVTVHRVPVSSSILVNNVASNTTRDTLKYFFTNPRIGGEVTSIWYEKGNEQAVVTFKDHDVMQKVLSSKSLKLDGAELRVEKITVPIQEKKKKQHSQQKIKVDKDVMEFVSATDSLSELQESLRVHGFAITYNIGDSLAYIKRVKQTSVDKEKGIQTLADFTKKFKVMKLAVDKNHWDAVIDKISKLHNEIGKDKLLVKECASKDKITIVCREEDSEELKTLLTDKIVETQRLEAMNAHEKYTIDDIEKENLWLLRINGFDKKIMNEYSDIELNINKVKGEVTIAGPKQQCFEAKLKIYQEVTSFYEKQVSVPEFVMKAMNFQEIIERIFKEFMLLWKTRTIAILTKDFGVCIGGIKENVSRAKERIQEFLQVENPNIRKDKKVVIHDVTADGYRTIAAAAGPGYGGMRVCLWRSTSYV